VEIGSLVQLGLSATDYFEHGRRKSLGKPSQPGTFKVSGPLTTPFPWPPERDKRADFNQGG